MDPHLPHLKKKGGVGSEKFATKIPSKMDQIGFCSTLPMNKLAPGGSPTQKPTWHSWVKNSQDFFRNHVMGFMWEFPGKKKT